MEEIEKITAMIRIRREWAEAAQIREQWAQDRGCLDFKEAMKIGLARVANRPIQQWVPE